MNLTFCNVKIVPVIQTSGVCNFGKLNYFLGKRAHDEGRESRYPDIDFCKDPEVRVKEKQQQPFRGYTLYITSKHFSPKTIHIGHLRK